MNISNYLNFGGNPHIDQCDDVINEAVVDAFDNSDLYTDTA